MSSQKGNVSRSRGQKHQNNFAFKNDKYGATVQVKKAQSKNHNGLCQHCKSVLEWKVQYNKYKTLTQPKKCVKCFQKAVKDAYHIVCKPCSVELEICCKCGKKEEIVIPVNSQEDQKEEQEEDDEQKKKGRGRAKKVLDDLHSDDDDDKGEDFSSDSEPKKRYNRSDVLPEVSRVHFKD